MFIYAIYNLFFPKICGACSKLTIKFEDELCLRCELQLLNLAEPNANKIAKELKDFDFDIGMRAIGSVNEGVVQDDLEIISFDIITK